MRKMHVMLYIDTLIYADDDEIAASLSEIIDDLEIDISTVTSGADVIDYQIKDYDILDSR